MINYVNEDKFLRWYRAKAKAPAPDAEVLAGLYADFCETGKKVFSLAAKDTVTGKAAEYRYDVDNVGCCGASTVYVYF